MLAILSERPAHGFAIARLTAPGGDLGRIWQIPRPVIYRSITRLLEAGLLTQDAVESGRGPQRTLYTVTPEGRQLAGEWLDTPVEHVRDVRSHLLVKLALLDRAGRDPTDLLRRQRATLEPIARAVQAERPGRHGFDATLLAWRRATTAATLTFLDDVMGPRSSSTRTRVTPARMNAPPRNCTADGSWPSSSQANSDREQHLGHADERGELGAEPPGGADAGDIGDHRGHQRQPEHRHDPADLVAEEVRRGRCWRSSAARRSSRARPGRPRRRTSRPRP